MLYGRVMGDVSELRRLIVSAERYRHAYDERVGIGLAESQTLSLLILHGDLLPSQLAAGLVMTTGAVTNLLDRLVAIGLVQRTPHDSDRRKVVISLTERGRSVKTDSNYWLSEVIDRLPPLRRADRDATLTTVAEALDAISDELKAAPRF